MLHSCRHFSAQAIDAHSYDVISDLKNIIQFVL